MDEAKYIKFLEQAYKELPEIIHKRKRFEITNVRGKIIKTRTIISNFREIAKQFSRNEGHFFRFILKELGVRGDTNEKGELTLHSKFQPTILNKSVQKYFKTYVECKHCSSPDTELSSDFSQIKCKACGHIEHVSKI
jgi:translation initiation factor 2 subunit 2